MVSALRNLTRPAKVIAIVIAVLFAILGFFAKETYFKITGSNADAMASIARLERDKLDKAEYVKDCAVNKAEHEKKIDRSEYEARHGELLSRMNDSNQMMRELYKHQLGKQFHSKDEKK